MIGDKWGWLIVTGNAFAGLCNGWLVVYREWHWFELANVVVFCLCAVAVAGVLSYMLHPPP